jgi:glutamine amidotransferase
MANLRHHGLIEPVRDYLAAGRPFLGVCMGLQALMTGSEEGGWHPCLDVETGRVRRLPPGLKVPHMGWNQVERRRPHPILDGIDDGANFYFVHSYVCDPEDRTSVIATTTYGDPFAAILGRDRWVATQFHPEKSGDVGLRLYQNFLRWANTT